MNLKLKSVKHFESGSQETECFTADLWLGNKKVGYVSNDGHGGCHNITHYPKMRDTMNQIEAYCLTLPEVKGDTFTFKNDLEWQISEMLTAFLVNKEVTKHSRKGIYYEDKKGIKMLKTWSIPMWKMLNNPTQHNFILLKVNEIKMNGGTILNNNLKMFL